MLSCVVMRRIYFEKKWSDKKTISKRKMALINHTISKTEMALINQTMCQYWQQTAGCCASAGLRLRRLRLGLANVTSSALSGSRQALAQYCIA